MSISAGKIEVLKKGPVGTTALYGYTRNGGKTWHGGMDVVIPDLRVLVVEGGTVIQSRIVNNGIGSGTAEWGHYVAIKTNSGFYDTYAHLASRALKVGDKVKAGDLVGIMGNSGNAAGGYKHVHFERRKTPTGKGIDPSAVLGIKNAVGIYGGTSLSSLQIGPMSYGDRGTIEGMAKKLMVPVSLALTSGKLVTLRVGPMSGGDKKTFEAKAKALLLPVKAV